MPVKMQWSLRSTCLLWYILVPMVGTVLPIHQRENVWQQYRPSSDNLFSLSSGNIWQNQPFWDPPRPFHTGGAWQQWSSFDSPLPDQPRGVWQLWSSFDAISPVQPDLEDSRETFSHRKVCNYCFTLIPDEFEHICLKYRTCKNLDFLSSEHERFRDSSRCSLVPSSISKKVCEFCVELAEKTTTHLSVCNVYCPRVKRFLCV